jgi:flagellar biogenesis protein FliO
MMIDWDSFKQQVKKRPHKTLKFVGGLAITLTGLWILVLFQANSDRAEPYVSGQTYLVSQPADSSAVTDTVAHADSVHALPASAGEENELKLQYGAPAIEKDPENNASLPVLPVILSVAVIGGGMWLWSKIRQQKILKPARGSDSEKGSLKRIDEVRLGEEHTLQAVKVGEYIWLIGCYERGMEVMGKIKREEWDKNCPDTGSDSQPGSRSELFAGILKQIEGVKPEAVN